MDRCNCGFRFIVSQDDLAGWFYEMRRILETGYLKADTSWGRSGKSGSLEEWSRLRKPVFDCVDRFGTFLDIGCANGFLLECILEWASEKEIRVKPFGLDLSVELVKLARLRLREFSRNIFIGNAWYWEPPMRFDFVRTETCYVPFNIEAEFIARLLHLFVNDDGKLLVAQYRSGAEDLSKNWIDDHLRDLGFDVSFIRSGFSIDGLEKTRIAVLKRSDRNLN
jgi:SAM-dependent methyltransferase